MCYYLGLGQRSLSQYRRPNIDIFSEVDRFCSLGIWYAEQWTPSGIPHRNLAENIQNQLRICVYRRAERRDFKGKFRERIYNHAKHQSLCTHRWPNSISNRELKRLTKFENMKRRTVVGHVHKKTSRLYHSSIPAVETSKRSALKYVTVQQRRKLGSNASSIAAVWRSQVD